jgi:predicted DNA-binding mobile mystery protein A
MTANFRKLRLRQLDVALSLWRDVALPVRPATGWVRAIRGALGMSSAALARRLGITGSAVRKLENAESTDAITLATLRRVAAGLDCELQYALVPRQTLVALRTQQAVQVAREQVQAVLRTMALEDQEVELDSTQAQIDEVVQNLLSKSGKDLWG